MFYVRNLGVCAASGSHAAPPGSFQFVLPFDESVHGVSHFGPGVFGSSDSNEGIRGETTVPTNAAAGVAGYAMNPEGAPSGVLGRSAEGAGVLGRSDRGYGIIGFSGDPAIEVNLSGLTSGVFGASEDGPGVLGYARSKEQPAVYALGGLRAIRLDKQLAAEFVGDIRIEGDIFLPGAADCAEDFDVDDDPAIDPGTVMVIGNNGALQQSRRAYDKKIAGVVSGAGTYRPGIVLDKRAASGNRLPLSLIGKVFCKVDARYSPIEVGDLLTTSPTPGHAMKASDPGQAFGAVIGKALQPLSEGRASISILVALG